MPGPIALLPEPRAVFREAVEAAGGVVEPLSERTRGIVWLANTHSELLIEVLRDNPRIEWVQLPWAGVDAFAEAIASQARPGLLWTSAKGAYAQPVAEHALALTLALLRLLPRRLRARAWESGDDGQSLFGLHVVIVGAGGIALELIRTLAVFDAEVTIVRRSAIPVPDAARTATSDRLDAVLPDADVVIVAAALTDATASLLGAEQFALMKRTAYVVNVARGGLVDTNALVSALATGEIAGAAVDVTDPEPLPEGHPLWSAPNCIITPHAADTPAMTAPLLAERIRANVEAFLDHGRFVGVVDPVAGY
nr:D-isomer specific 2-hydroxyacid dehydrogenase family protein [Compostimonas suwonensis]